MVLKRFALLCGTGLVFATVAAHAQSKDGPSSENPRAPSDASSTSIDRLDDIVVTARKRSESLQSVPVAVSAISATQLKNNLTADLSKIGELAPQVNLAASGNNSGAVISIRGVASSAGNNGLDQSVLIDFDGVPLGRGRIIASPLYDLASVQILQGPQALFFGKNSPAGVISIRTADPSNRFEGYLTAGYEFVARERFVEGAVSVPLTSTLKSRFAFRASKLDGWIRNVATPQVDPINAAFTDPGATQGKLGPGTRDLSGRLTLQWEPGGGFDAKLKISVNSRATNGEALESYCINGQTIPLVRAIPNPRGDCLADRTRSAGAVAPQYVANVPYANGGVPYTRSDLVLASLTMNKTFDNVTLTSTTGFYNQVGKALNNLELSAYAEVYVAQREKYQLFTQELRGTTSFDGPLDFSGGVYWETSRRPFTNGADIGHVFNPIAGNYLTNLVSSVGKDDTISAFGQLRWNIFSNLELAGGARWSNNRKSLSVQNLSVGPTSTATLLPVGKVVEGTYRDDNVSPEITLTWRPTRRQTLYLAWKTGYKAGGLSNSVQPAITLTPENMLFQPEKARGFEAGYKAETTDGKLRFDVEAYRYDYSGLQVSSYIPPATITLTNAASSRIEGVQGSVDFLAATGLTLRGNFGYNNARYRRFTTSACYSGQTAATGCSGGLFQDLSGKRLFLAPAFTFSAGADYNPRLVAGWNTAFSISAKHSSSYNVATNNSPGGFQNAYWLLNASLRVGPKDGPLEVALVGRNLTNSYYLLYTVNQTFGTANQFAGNFSRPREVVLQATLRF
jgi:iron complex outermembrane receptor protein